ncbi:MAG TPA: nucleotidyltransferase domain-containing protein [Kofleriaceae bacterium]|nr:nucleotidyltransferase domain-containing protein [Kofleriaceae bacterium]
MSRIPFDEVDPFNPNRVCGYVLRSRRRRGDLEITHVNGRACPQYVHGTPRIKHLEPERAVPDFERDFERAHVYEKIDGTNVLLFRYTDARGECFVSYKTRFSPFLRAQPYGDFVALWTEILARYRSEIAALAACQHAFGFELFGCRLRILTEYETPLDARLLYALDATTGRVLDPAAVPPSGFPTPSQWGEYPAGTSASAIHAAVIARCAEAGPEHAPAEGAVIYLVRDGAATLYKCKPEAVRERQARYRELYAHGKTAGTRDPDAVLGQLASYVERRWPLELRAKHHDVIEIVREDLRKELAFDAATDAAIDAPTDAEPPPPPIADDQLVLWKTIWGSQLWGMAGPASDTDTCIVYRLDPETRTRAEPEPELLEPHRTGWHRKTCAGDEHYYELERVVELLLRGSLTLLLGVMSPLVVSARGAAHAELRGLLEASPSRVFYRAILRDTKDSERMMARARERAHYLKHLRIACRNLRFGITLFTEGRYVFRPSQADDAGELAALRSELIAAYASSRLPERFDCRPFDDYLSRWRGGRD